MSELQMKIAAVARYLEPWTPKNDRQPERAAMLVHPDVPDAYLYFQTFGNRRIEVRGGFPRDFYPLPERRPRITVSADREPVSIARDVARRFLPAYIPLFQEMEAQAAAYAHRNAQRNEALETLAQALGVEVRTYHDLNTQGQITHYGPDYTRFKVTTSAAYDEVTADLHLERLPLAVALQVCQVVAKELNL
jgi:hypothetical protein